MTNIGINARIYNQSKGDKEMKSKIKNIITLILCLFVSISSIVVANAEEVLESFYATSKTIETPIDFITDFHVIKTIDGKHVYCIYYAKKSPNEKVHYTKDYLITDNGMNYLLKEGSKAVTDNDHYIYKSALWIYMVEKDLMPGGHKNVDAYYENVKKSNTAEAKKILALVEQAKKAGKNDTTAPTISISPASSSFEKTDAEGKYYVSNSITVTSSTTSYEVTLTDAPKGSLVEKNGNTFIIKVPTNAVAEFEDTISYKVSNTKDIHTSYAYKPSDSNYQTIAATFKETKTASTTGKISLSKTTSVPFLKIDAETNEAISGAEFKLSNSKGEVIATWTSETKEHIVTGLHVGEYTLTETKAPEGYKSLTTTVKFSINNKGEIIDANGKNINIIKIANERKTGGVSISKQDITNKEELPGATLVIKDYKGNEVESWVSTTEPHYIEKLTPGTYTLTETIAPEGYILSDETITFTVKDDGSITKVVMYNSPNGKEVPVEPTSSFKTLTSSLIGIIVITIGSLIIFKNYKKKEIM